MCTCHGTCGQQTISAEYMRTIDDVTCILTLYICHWYCKLCYCCLVLCDLKVYLLTNIKLNMNTYIYKYN